MSYRRAVDPEIEYAQDRVFSDYGDVVSVAEKGKSLLKFGNNPLVQTSPSTLMTLPVGEVHETYVSSNLITHFASSSGSDTGSMVVEGHTISGGLFTFVTQTVTLAGQTKTALTTPLARVSRAYNSSATDWVGAIYIAEDDTFTSGVPQTATKIHLTVVAGENQSDKAATTISNQDYYFVTEFSGDFLKKAAGFAEVHLEIREAGGVFRSVSHLAISSSNNTNQLTFIPYLIVKKNSDIRIVADADTNNTEVAGQMQGYLAIVT